MAFTGLSLALQKGGPSVLSPVNGEVDLSLSWTLKKRQQPAGRSSSPRVTLAVSLEPVQVLLGTADLVSLVSLSHSVFAAAAHQGLAAAGDDGEALLRPPASLMPPPAQQQQQRRPQQLGAAALLGAAAPPLSSSFILEDLMLPGCEGLVQEALHSASSITGQVWSGSVECGRACCWESPALCLLCHCLRLPQG